MRSLLAAVVALEGLQAWALRTKATFQPILGLRDHGHMSVAALEPFASLRVSGPMAVNVITMPGTKRPYLIRERDTALSTWVTGFNVSASERELALEFGGPNLVRVVATIVVPLPMKSVRATYQANVTLDYSGAELAADTFASVRVGTAFLPKDFMAPQIEVTAMGNVTVGTLIALTGAQEMSISACSHGTIRIGRYKAKDVEEPIRIKASNMGMVLIDDLFAPRCRELHVRSAEQGHVWTRGGRAGRADVVATTGSIASLAHSTTAESRIYSNSGAVATLRGEQIRVYASCNSGSLVRVVGAKLLDRKPSTGCHIWQPGEVEFDASYCQFSYGHWTAACALAPMPPYPWMMEGLKAPLGSLVWLTLGGHHDPGTPEAKRAIDAVVFKNAELYTGLHWIINRYDRRWEQSLLNEHAALAKGLVAL